MGLALTCSAQSFACICWTGRLCEPEPYTLQQKSPARAVSCLVLSGDRASTANHRPIAVTEPVLRLYTGIILQRLSAHTEREQLRTLTQAGFRPGLSVVHQGFALQQLIDAQQQRSKKLYVCLLDLKGAYDRVNRALLWQVLQRLGVGRCMLAAVQSLYSSASVAVRIGGRHGPKLPSRTGVRQGCPLSPKLFGLFADGLHRFLQHTVSAHGVRLHAGLRVTDLAYADDMLLVSERPQSLQCLIDATTAWCTAVGMQLSPHKSLCMELTSENTEPAAFSCAGQELAFERKARYLGFMFGAGAGVGPSCTSMCSRLGHAWDDLQAKYGRLDCIQSVSLLLKLFQACVVPRGSFGSEVWGVYPLRGAPSHARKHLDKLHLGLLRQLAGLHCKTPTPVVYRELSVLPLHYEWLVSAARFWNSLRSGAGLHHTLLLDSVRLANRGRRSWAQGLHRHLAEVGYVLDLAAAELAPIDLVSLRHRIAAKQAVVWEGLDVCPRQAPSEPRLCAYQHYFARRQGCRLSVLEIPVRPSVLRRFLRFRTGYHELPIDMGSRGKDPIPRQERLCKLCEGGLGDELHLVFDCPALQDIRDQYAHLFVGASSMAQFVWQQPLQDIAHFVHRCLRRVHDRPGGGSEAG